MNIDYVQACAEYLQKKRALLISDKYDPLSDDELQSLKKDCELWYLESFHKKALEKEKMEQEKAREEENKEEEDVMEWYKRSQGLNNDSYLDDLYEEKGI